MVDHHLLMKGVAPVNVSRSVEVADAAIGRRATGRNCVRKIPRMILKM
jgi:hypothetical protein